MTFTLKKKKFNNYNDVQQCGVHIYRCTMVCLRNNINKYDVYSKILKICFLCFKLEEKNGAYKFNNLKNNF